MRSVQATNIWAAAIVCWMVLTAPGTASAQASASATHGGGSDRIVLSQALPPLDGRNLKVTVLEVTYGPGESSPPHSHPCAVVGYVVEGALRSKVSGEPERVYKASESFYEAPNGIHEVSADASKTKPVKFVVYFLCDRQLPLIVPPPTADQGKHK